MKGEEITKKLKLSVALCTYNGEPFIEEQLNSIVKQQMPIDEIIICDDVSTDHTLSIINDYTLKNPDINWIVIKNSQQLGVTKNFEKALSLCSGDFIFLSDQDDIWRPDKTKKIIDYFKNHAEIELVFSNAKLIDENGIPKSDKTLFDACGLNQLRKQWEQGLQFEIENVIQRLLGATFGIRKEFLQQCLPFNQEFINYHDGQIAMQSVVNHCNGMIDECLIDYRIHGNNVVGLGKSRNWVFSTGICPNEFASLLEPRPINPFFLSNKADKIRDRIDFFRKRVHYYKSGKGKIILLLSAYQYVKYYKRFWHYFFFCDLLYGVSKRLRNRIAYQK
ncbi:MAG: glycosyltransferase family 2 protein [Prevotella sp.]|nr:glycosyltransferase family 2 protein [Prevotella sp.]